MLRIKEVENLELVREARPWEEGTVLGQELGLRGLPTKQVEVRWRWGGAGLVQQTKRPLKWARPRDQLVAARSATV